MPIEVKKINWKSLKEWLELNMTSHIISTKTEKEDKDLLISLRKNLDHSIQTLEGTCHTYDIHTKDGLRFYMSTISSMSTFLTMNKTFKDIESKVNSGEIEGGEWLIESLKIITQGSSDIHEQIKTLNMRIEKILGPSIKWWIEKELGEEVDKTVLLKEALLELFKENFPDDPC